MDSMVVSGLVLFSSFYNVYLLFLRFCCSLDVGTTFGVLA
jgi:hypothetical protein